MQQQKYGEAYALLAPLADQRAGDPEFDFIFGVAALDAGHETEAIFALERVLVVAPDNAEARAALARAHLRLGELEQAGFEFRNARDAGVPASMERTINDYLSAIEGELNRPRTTYDVFIQLGAGYDQNVNNATDVSSVAVPALGGLIFNLDNTGREASSSIFDLQAGFGFRTPVQRFDDLQFFGRMALDERIAINQSDFSQRTLGGTSGFHYTRDRHQFTLAAQVQRFFVGGDPNRDLFGGTAQWQYSLSDQTQLTLFGQMAALRFPDQEVRDADRYTGGVGFGHAFGGRGAPVVFVSAYGGTEDEVEGRRPDIGRDLFGVNLGAQYTFAPNIIGYLNANYEDSDYGGTDPLFLRSRDDEFVDVAAGLRVGVNRHWSVRPEIRYSRNDSTLVINDYDRVNVMVYLRNDF
ncbi:MAG: outer membrane beta-barrel protein [Gammaproteobacteria bacterium]